MPDAIKVLAIKKEATYATDAAPTLAANAVLTRNFSAKPVEADRLERNLDTGKWGATASAMSNERQTVSFEVEMAGSGAAGTAPPWMALLEGCGCAAAALTATVKAEQKFALPGTAQSSLTADHWIDNQKRKMVGARGSFGIDFTAGQYPFLALNLTGLIPAGGFSTATPTGASFTAWKQPLEVNMANTAILLDGYAAAVKALRLDANLQTAVRNLVGSRYVNRGPHAMAGRMTIEAPALLTKDYLATLRGGSLVALTLTHGTVAGNIIELSVPKLQITDITESEEDGKLMWELAIAATVDQGADDLLITAR